MSQTYLEGEHVKVKLTPTEMREARAVAVRRHMSQRNAGRLDWKAKPSADGARNDLLGLLGEIAVRDAFRCHFSDHLAVLPILEWDATRRERCITDVDGMEVRAVARSPQDVRLTEGRTSLIVKKDKDAGKQDVAFVLVLVTELDAETFGQVITVAGWAYGYEAMKPEFWRGEEENATRANYFLPLEKLRPILSLYEARKQSMPKTLAEQDADRYRDLDLSALLTG